CFEYPTLCVLTHRHVSVRAQELHERCLIRGVENSRDALGRQGLAQDTNRFFVVSGELRRDVGERRLLEYQPAARPRGYTDRVSNCHAQGRMMFGNDRLLAACELDRLDGQCCNGWRLPRRRAPAVCHTNATFEHGYDGPGIVGVYVEFSADGDDLGLAGEDA